MKEKIFSIIRHGLSMVAGIVVAQGVLSEGMAMEVVGGLMAVVSVVWSLKDKTATVSMLEGTIRQVITLLGGFLTFISPEKFATYSGLILAILPTILGQIKGLKQDEPIVNEQE